MSCGKSSLDTVLVLSLFTLMLLAGCTPSDCPTDTNCEGNAGDDDDSATHGQDDDDDDSADDDDSTPDPENPFGGSAHEGDYVGQWDLSYTGTDAGVSFCSGSTEINITENGTLSGQGTCVLTLNGQPLDPEVTISFSTLAEMTDIGNMNNGQITHTLSHAPAEELKFLLDGSASQGIVDLQWSGTLPLPDAERTFAGHLSAELSSR